MQVVSVTGVLTISEEEHVLRFSRIGDVVSVRGVEGGEPIFMEIVNVGQYAVIVEKLKGQASSRLVTLEEAAKLISWVYEQMGVKVRVAWGTR